MTANRTTNTVERLAPRLGELESQPDVDSQDVIYQFEDNCHHLREACDEFPDHLHELRKDPGIGWYEMKAQPDEPEAQLALVRMETVETFRERQEGIMASPSAMEDARRRIELAEEDDEGFLQYKNFAGQARKLQFECESYRRGA